MKRKEFLQQLAALTAGLLVPARSESADAAEEAATHGDKSLPKRQFGSTDIVLPVLGLGGYHVGKAAKESQARAVIDTAFEEGVRFMDSAESYQQGRSERWLGASLESVREDVFLMTKTHAPEERSAESARRHLEGSLQRLRTDHLDLWQLHAVRSEKDVERSFRSDGAMRYIMDMKEKSVVKYVGVTGHADPAALRRAIQFWDEGWKFDALQFPVNPVDFHQLSFQSEVLPAAVKRGIAVLGMKTAAGGALFKHGVCSAEDCHRYAISLPISVAIIGMETPEEVRQNATVFRDRDPLTPDTAAALLDRIRPQVELKLEYYKSPQDG